MPIDPNSDTCFEDEMSLFKAGKMHSGVGKAGKKGPVVKSERQAKAIASSVCNHKEYGDFLVGLGFSEEQVKKVARMLPDWKNQFENNDTLSNLDRENKTTIAPSLPGLDIDNRPGKQKGDMGKHKDSSSQAIQGPAVMPSNPHQGPRSRSDLKGTAAF